MIFLSGFQGTKALVAKIIFLGLINSLLIYMIFVALGKDQTQIAAVLIVVALGANIVYFSKRTVPLKFLYPGVVLLSVFVLVPVLYTILMSSFTYKTGNEIAKPDAITQILETGLETDEAGTAYDMVLGKFENKYAALVTNQINGEVSLATQKSVTALLPGSFQKDEYGVANQYEGFTRLTDDELANADSIIGELKFPLGSGQFIAPQSTDVAILLTQAYEYSKEKDEFRNLITGAIYRDNGDGNFANIDDSTDKLTPGWRDFNTFQNYVNLLRDPVLRDPFIGVFLWTFSFALLTVLMMFSVGLLLAIAMDKKIRFRSFYRSILILPYAIPSFMSILIWNGMFNRQFGAVNQLIGSEIDWLNSPTLAKIVILIVNLWLGFPYFYLISSGALQAIPNELEEAASIDGATPRQVLRLIKLPLLLQILSPLLIASFAFNFNNFNIVYLLTGGGPTDVLAGEVAGATDILITYTYKTAFGSNEQNLGLASSISVIMFIIVGALSLWSLRRSKVLDAL